MLDARLLVVLTLRLLPSTVSAVVPCCAAGCPSGGVGCATVPAVLIVLLSFYFVCFVLDFGTDTVPGSLG